MSDYIPASADALLSAARRQARPRRWPWQPKTMRDRLNDWGGDLAEIAASQGEVLLEYVRQQSRPRRWPWQQKTLRDHIDARSSDLASVAAERSAELADVIASRSAEIAGLVADRRDALVSEAKKQSRPRRWPWQQKTARDKINERSAKLAALAATRSLELAEQAAARRDVLLAEAKKQSRPRRWPWQQKTVRDRLDEQTAVVRDATNERFAVARDAANERLALANEKIQQGKATLSQTSAQALAEAKRQSQPRRWPWQQKTVRDRLNDQSAATRDAAAERLALANEKLQLATQTSAQALAEAKKQSQPRRRFWQKKTARDRLNERAAELKANALKGATDLRASAADQAALTNEKIQHAAKIGAGAAVAGAALAAAQARRAADQAQSLPDQVLPVLKDQASAAGAAVQHAGAAVQQAVASVPEVLGSAASSVADSVKDAASSVSKSVSGGASTSSSAVRAAVRAPVDAVNYRIKAGKTSVNHGVHLVTTALRWAIIGFIIGLLTSPASGKELRRQIRDATVRIIDSVLQPN